MSDHYKHNYLPVCPWCGAELDRPKRKPIGRDADEHFLLACPKCEMWMEVTQHTRVTFSTELPFKFRHHE